MFAELEVGCITCACFPLVRMQQCAHLAGKWTRLALKKGKMNSGGLISSPSLQPGHPRIHGHLRSTQRTHPLPRGASPSPIQSLHPTQRPGFLGDGKSSPIDPEVAPRGSSDLKTKTQAFCISPAHLFPRIMVSLRVYGTSSPHARDHIQVPSLYIVLADFLTSS